MPANAEDLRHVLSEEGDALFAYALSFAVLGRLWIAHHSLFAQIARFDGRLMALNLLYLAFVALIPWTSEILGDYGDESAGVIIYAIGMAAVMLALAAQVRYAFRRGMIRAGARGRPEAYAGVKGLLSPAIFLASIPVALLSPSAATLMWLLLFVAGGRGGDRVARAVRGG